VAQRGIVGIKALISHAPFVLLITLLFLNNQRRCQSAHGLPVPPSILSENTTQRTHEFPMTRCLHHCTYVCMTNSNPASGMLYFCLPRLLANLFKPRLQKSIFLPNTSPQSSKTSQHLAYEFLALGVHTRAAICGDFSKIIIIYCSIYGSVSLDGYLYLAYPRSFVLHQNHRLLTLKRRGYLECSAVALRLSKDLHGLPMTERERTRSYTLSVMSASDFLFQTYLPFSRSGYLKTTDA
jgi:hypothetical protein